MNRLHLFEFEDMSWCPKFIRETTTDFLLAYYKFQNVYEPAFKKIYEIIEKTNTNSIVDCCSGSGGPVKRLREYLDNINQSTIHINLTDKYPNIELFKKLEEHHPENIVAHTTSIDAAQLPSSLKGMRTLFSSFHHFKPDSAVKILQNAVDNDAPIGIFEFTQRHPSEIIRIILSPLILLIVVPLAKRLNWKKFLFTYIIPITPITHMWEYLVSCLRTYSPKELHALTQKVNAPHYTWDIGKIWSEQARCYITYLIGHKTTS